MPRVKGKTEPESQETELRSQLDEFETALLVRIDFIGSKAISLRAKEPDSPVLELLTNIIIDIKRTMDSKNKYLKKIAHFSVLGKSQKDQMIEIVPITIDAALSVIDKRFIQSIDLYAQMNSNKAVSVQKMITSYLSTVRPEMNKKELIEINARLLAMGDPYRPHFSQTFAENKFGSTINIATSSLDIIGKPVREVGQLIKDNPLKREQINVGVFFHNGAWISMNNRSLSAACCSGIEPRLEVIFPDEAFIDYYTEKIKSDVLEDPFSIRLEDKTTRSAARNYPKVSVPPRWHLVCVTTPSSEVVPISDSVSTKSDTAGLDIAKEHAPLAEVRETMQKFKEAVPQSSALPEDVEHGKTPQEASTKPK